MVTSHVISSTLLCTTESKVKQLHKYYKLFMEAHDDILKRANESSRVHEKVRILVVGLKCLDSLGNVGRASSGTIDLLKRRIAQSDFDPSISEATLNDWAKRLHNELAIRLERFEYADMYSSLIRQWILEKLGGETPKPPTREPANTYTCEVLRTQREAWESYVFTPLQTDVVKINSYLSEVFRSTPGPCNVHDVVVGSTAKFEQELAKRPAFDRKTLAWCIDGLIADDLLSDVKRNSLININNNEEICTEIIDILNLRMAAFETWDWGDEPNLIETRRTIEGRYRFFDDCDLIQTLFLRFVGVKWSVHFKRKLSLFTHTSSSWFDSKASISWEEKSDFRSFMKSYKRDLSDSVESRREYLYRKEIFLEQLQSSETECSGRYLADDLTDGWKAPAGGRKTPQQMTQLVLRLLRTDIIIKSRLGQDVAVVRSDFKSFGPSLPHSTILTVLGFFGVSRQWLTFFKRVLKSPVKFIEDGPGAPARIKQRGTPMMSEPLSNVMSEIVLFCLDFAFNMETDGGRLYRLGDDFWMWGNQQTCEAGWAVAKEFAELMGLEFNAKKTGSVVIAHTDRNKVAGTLSTDGVMAHVQNGLPQGPVQWGLLQLDPATGRFLLHERRFESAVEELGRQLHACSSIFGWIRAWNLYGVNWFTAELGPPGLCNGPEHVDMIIEAFQFIQRKLFAEDQTFKGKSAAEKLIHMIRTQFGFRVTNGSIHFPAEEGGLGLQNPFLMACQDWTYEESTPDAEMDEFFSAERRTYLDMKEAASNAEDEALRATFSFEKFTRYREEMSPDLLDVFHKLMEEHQVEPIPVRSEDLRAWGCSKEFYNSMTPSQQSIIQSHGNEVVEKFGGLCIIGKEYLATGIINKARRDHYHWAD